MIWIYIWHISIQYNAKQCNAIHTFIIFVCISYCMRINICIQHIECEWKSIENKKNSAWASLPNQNVTSWVFTAAPNTTFDFNFKLLCFVISGAFLWAQILEDEHLDSSWGTTCLKQSMGSPAWKACKYSRRFLKFVRVWSANVQHSKKLNWLGIILLQRLPWHPLKTRSCTDRFNLS